MAKARIMVVEDDVAISEMVDMMLSMQGYETILWPKGEGAYETLRTEQPDLLILDMMLEHNWTGDKVLVLKEQDDLVKHIPVIICSASLEVQRKEKQIYQDKGYGVVCKPYDPPSLIAEIRRLLAAS